MWARTVEVMLGLWLTISPFIFRHESTQTIHWINDLACGVIVMIIALLAWYHPLRRIHLAELIVAGWLIGFGYFYGGFPSPAASQNQLIIGLMLAMFAIIPSNASEATDSWKAYNEKLKGEGTSEPS